MDRARISDEDQFGVVLEGLGEEDAFVFAGGVEVVQESGGAWGGFERQLKGLDLLGILARLEAIEIAFGRARAGPAAASFLGC